MITSDSERMKQSTSCSVADTYKWIILLLSYSLVFLVGLCLNGALLWSVCCSRTRTWSCMVIYLTNLAVADLLYVLAFPPIIVSYALRGEWLFGDIACKAVRFLFRANLHGSMVFLACVSVHRFLGVCFPIASLRIRTKKRLAVFVSGGAWVAVTVVVLPTIAYARTGSRDNVTVCFEMTDPRDISTYVPYGVFLTVVGFLLPFLVVVSCYCAMIRTLCCRNGPVASRAGRTAKTRRNRSLRTILTVCLIFVLCFVPYHVAQTVYMFVRVYMAGDCRLLHVVRISYEVWKPLVNLNCCANPLLYFMGSDRHRKKLQAWLRRKSTMVHPGVYVVDTPSRVGAAPGELR